MQDLNFLYKSWKIIFASGILSLFISVIIILVALHNFAPLLKNFYQKRLRDQHEEPVPKIGGLGMMLSFFLTVLLLRLFPSETNTPHLEILDQSRLLGLTLGGILAFGLGFIDDLLQLRARWKLLGQSLLAIFAILSGFSFNNLQGPFFQEIDTGFLSLPITVFWIVIVMNAINLIDGLDGLAGGISLTILFTLCVILWWKGALPLLLLNIALFGAVFGFLLFNRSPAITFMGDSGSQFLGYMVALISIWATETYDGKQSMLPILILAIPLLDTFFAFTRRLFKGIPFYSADKDHLHHRLVMKGFSPSKSVLILVFVSFFFSFLALMVVYNSYLQGFSYILGFLMCFLILYILEYDLLRKPVISIQGQNNSRKRRELMIALGDQIDGFLEKDFDSSTVFHSFNYWCKLAEISQYKLKHQNKDYHNYGIFEDSLRIIVYKFQEWEIHFGLPRESWSVDSDVKGDLMEKVSCALVKRLEQLETFKGR